MQRPRPIIQPEPPEGGGIITSISVQKKDVNRCSIQLDGQFAFGLHMDIVVEHGLARNRSLSEEECRSILEKDLYFKLMKRAMDLLAYRPRSRTELTTRLSLLGASPDMANRVLTRLTHLGYIDDTSFAQQFAAARLASGKYGPERVRLDLRKRGIQESLIERVLGNIVETDAMEATLADLAERAAKKYARIESDRERKQKMTAWLRRRGFQYDAIRAALECTNP